MKARHFVFAFAVAVALATLLAVPASASVSVDSFTAQTQTGQVHVEWSTSNEVNNLGFNLLRSTSATGTYTKLNASLIPSQCLGCLIGANYSYNDVTATPGTRYYYKLQSVDFRGATQDYGPIAVPSATMSATPTRTLAPNSTPIPPTPTSNPPNATATAAVSTVPPLPTPLSTVIARVVTVPPNVAASPTISRAAGRPPTGSPTPPATLQAMAIPTQPARATPAIEESEPAIDQSASDEVSPAPAALDYVRIGIFATSGLFACGTLLCVILGLALYLRPRVRR